MIELTRAQQADADLIEETLIDLATELIVAVRDHGPDTIGRILARVPQGKRQRDLFDVVLAAMVSPDATMRQLLGWTDTMTPPPMRGRRPREDDDPPAERERQRLVAAGVPADTAILMAAREAVAKPTARQATLRVIHGERTA